MEHNIWYFISVMSWWYWFLHGFPVGLFRHVPSAPIRISTTITFILPNFFSFLDRSRYIYIYSYFYFFVILLSSNGPMKFHFLALDFSPFVQDNYTWILMECLKYYYSFWCLYIHMHAIGSNQSPEAKDGLSWHTYIIYRGTLMWVMVSKLSC